MRLRHLLAGLLLAPCAALTAQQDAATLHADSLRGSVTDGNAYIVTLPAEQSAGSTATLAVFYGGKPHVAKRAPWDGGFVFTADSLGRTVIATACQGTGASIWWPTKDIQSDEPDSQRVAITVPDAIRNISNGRLRSSTPNGDGTTTWEWFVTSPINNYDIAVNAASYGHLEDSYEGEGGRLTLNYWPLDYHLEAARRQFATVVGRYQLMHATRALLREAERRDIP